MLWQKVQFDPLMRQLIGTAQNSWFLQKSPLTYWAVKIFLKFTYICATPHMEKCRVKMFPTRCVCVCVLYIFTWWHVCICVCVCLSASAQTFNTWSGKTTASHMGQSPTAAVSPSVVISPSVSSSHVETFLTPFIISPLVHFFSRPLLFFLSLPTYHCLICYCQIIFFVVVTLGLL